MKKTIFLFFLLLFSIFYSVAQQVTLRGKHFYLGNERFYPKALNYIIDFTHIDSVKFFISPHGKYNKSTDFYCNDTSSCAIKIKEDFDYIAAMGFNTVRIIGIQPSWCDTTNFDIVYSFLNYKTVDPMVKKPVNQTSMNIVFPFYDKLFEIASESSLKIILVVTKPSSKFENSEFKKWNNYLETLSSHFSNSPYSDVLLAYDLINEPSLIIKDKTKQDACKIISSWYGIIKDNHPKSLVTIGNYNIEDLFSFDPSILRVDFNSLHYYPSIRTYEDRSDPAIQDLMRRRTANILYWFNRISVAPWIIGETGFSATKDTTLLIYGNLNDQEVYAQFSLDAVCNCGGSGYSWWQYKDVRWFGVSDPFNQFKENFFGLLEVGTTPAEKDAANVFRNYPALPVLVPNSCPVDYSPDFNENKLYYNPFGHTAHDSLKIESIVKDQNGKPIRDAVVWVWTAIPNISKTYKTFTDVNGKFVAIPSPKSEFIGAQPNDIPKIAQIKVSAAGAEVKVYGSWANTPVPATIILKKINFDIVVSGETVLSGENKEYSGRKSLTVSNTEIKTGGTATFTSSTIITLLPGVKADAGSNVLMYITPSDCDGVDIISPSKIDSDDIGKTINNGTKSKEPKKIELKFKK